MKKWLAAVAAVLVAGLIVFVLIPKNEAAPSFLLQDLNGKQVSNADLQGKVTFVNFWFPSCPGCASEMPKIIKMAHDYQGKPFQVFGVAVPVDSIEQVRNYAASNRLPFVVMYDNGSTVSKAFKTTVYPTSVLINKKGEILKTFVGEPNFPQLYQQIDEELNK